MRKLRKPIILALFSSVLILSKTVTIGQRRPTHVRQRASVQDFSLWREVTLANAGFSARFPSTPRHDPPVDNTDVDGYGFEDVDGTTYAVFVSPGGPTRIHAHPSGSFAEPKTVDISGCSGDELLEYMYDTKLYVRTHIVNTVTRGYQIMIGARSKEVLFSQRANFFMNSFELLNAECGHSALARSQEEVGSRNTGPIGMSPHDIAQKASPSVVLLVMEDTSGQPISLGSGFFVKPNLIATNKHVIAGASRGYAKLVGQTAKFNILGVAAQDDKHDLVLLSVDGASAPSLALETNVRPEVGDEIYVIGNPEGLEGTFSQGLVSSVRKVDSDTLIQVTAPISPGSSGGPVLNVRGKVVGVAVASFKQGQNLNFAIPAFHLSPLLSAASPVTRAGRVPTIAGVGTPPPPVRRGVTVVVGGADTNDAAPLGGAGTGTLVVAPKVEVADEPPPPKPTPPKLPLSGGVLNDKAISLPKPLYPAIAKPAHAFGTVVVQVVIDENGNVISAHAVSGHPLLQTVAVSAARQAKFLPAKISDQPVKVIGVITYSFLAQ